MHSTLSPFELVSEFERHLNITPQVWYKAIASLTMKRLRMMKHVSTCFLEFLDWDVGSLDQNFEVLTLSHEPDFL